MNNISLKSIQSDYRFVSIAFKFWNHATQNVLKSKSHYIEDYWEINSSTVNFVCHLSPFFQRGEHGLSFHRQNHGSCMKLWARMNWLVERCFSMRRSGVRIPFAVSLCDNTIGLVPITATLSSPPSLYRTTWKYIEFLVYYILLMSFYFHNVLCFMFLCFMSSLFPLIV